MEYRFSEKVSHIKASAIREILKFTSEPGVISLAAGNPAPEAFPVEDITRFSREIFEEVLVWIHLTRIFHGKFSNRSPLRNSIFPLWIVCAAIFKIYVSSISLCLPDDFPMGIRNINERFQIHFCTSERDIITTK